MKTSLLAAVYFRPSAEGQENDVAVDVEAAVVVVLVLETAVLSVVLVMYTFSLFGPPQYSSVLLAQSISQSVDAARSAPELKELPQ